MAFELFVILVEAGEVRCMEGEQVTHLADDQRSQEAPTHTSPENRLPCWLPRSAGATIS